MFVRMLVRAALLRRGRAASALLAMTVAAAVATAVLNLYVDVQAKLQREFRNYGANIVIVGKSGASLPTHTQERVEATLAGRGLVAPFALVVARTGEGQSVVVVGTDFSRVRQLNRWWSVSHWPSAPQEALIGVRAVAAVSPKNQPFDLSFQGHTITLSPAGTVQTGGAEDSRVYLSLPDFVAWSGVRPSTIEVAANGSPEEITAIMKQFAQALPAADVRPVRQIMEGEARVLGKTRSTLLAASALIILTAALCVLSTLMGWVFDRRRDFAIMKALGASERLLSGFFAAEAAALGATGALFGFLVGIGIAAWIGRVNFHAPVAPRFSVLPIVLAGSIAVTLISAILPISLLRRVQPAVILRGE
jgi:putative ABC transport system permease protein